jgi:uncharacterized protein (TIGR02001 family)
MNMKKTIVSALSFVIALSTMSAAVDVTVGYTSDYYFRGTQLADDILEAEVEISLDEGFYLGVWTAQPLTNPAPGWLFENEVNFWAGYGLDVGSGVEMDFGLTAYWYPELSDDDSVTYEAYMGAAFDTLLDPSVYVFYDFTLKALTLEGSIGYSYEIDEVSSLDFGLSLGYVDPDGGDSGIYYLVSVGYGYALAENASFSLSANYTDGDSALSGYNWDDGFYFAAGLTVGF